MIDAAGLDPDADDHVRGRAGAGRRRPGQAGAGRDDRPGHRRRQRQGRRSPRPIDDPRFVGGHPMAGSELDGLDGADGDDVQRRGVGADADRRHRRRDVQRRRRGRRRARRRGRRPDARAPRPGGRRDQPRPAPHRGDADGPRQRSRRGARRAAAPRRRRLPRHDPHRSRPPDIWLDICAENRPAIVVRARRPDRAASPRCATVVDTDDRDGAARRAARRPARRAPTCRAASTSPSELAEVRIPIPDRPGAAAEMFTLAAELGVNIASFEVVHMRRGQPRRRRRARRRGDQPTSSAAG